MSANKLTNHLVGNAVMWLYYRGKKSIDEVAETDNSTIGFIIILIVLFSVLAFCL